MNQYRPGRAEPWALSAGAGLSRRRRPTIERTFGSERRVEVQG
jgi:hypothetical protein